MCRVVCVMLYMVCACGVCAVCIVCYVYVMGIGYGVCIVRFGMYDVNHVRGRCVCVLGDVCTVCGVGDVCVLCVACVVCDVACMWRIGCMVYVL